MKLIYFFFFLLFCACSGGGGDGANDTKLDLNQEELINVSEELSALGGEVQETNHSFTRAELDQLLAQSVITEKEHQELLGLVQN